VLIPLLHPRSTQYPSYFPNNIFLVFHVNRVTLVHLLIGSEFAVIKNVNRNDAYSFFL